MPKIASTRVGSVFLKQLPGGRWRASWTDPLTRRWIRRKLPAATFRDATEQARTINREIARDRGFGGRLRGGSGHGVLEAILMAVKATSANPRVRTNYAYNANPFLGFLSQRFPGLQTWSEVSEEIVAAYAEHCRRENVAPATLKHRLDALRRTSSFMSRTFPLQYRDVAKAVRISLPLTSKAEIEPADYVLEPATLRRFIAWLRERFPMVGLWAMGQGLAGLRLLEMAYLKEEDFDAGRRLLRIRDNEAHKVKTASSARTIPIPKVLAEALADWISNRPVRHVAGFLFAPCRTTRPAMQAKSVEAQAGVYRADYVARMWQRALRAVPDREWALPAKFTPRRLRTTFVTLIRRAGCDAFLLERFIGHRPSTLLARHYDLTDPERLPPIADFGDQLWRGCGVFAGSEKLAKTE